MGTKKATAEALRKKNYKRKEDKEEQEKKQTDGYFNQGRLSCDHKWRDAIDDRIKELEIQVGIPELKKLKKSVSYKWGEND